ASTNRDAAESALKSVEACTATVQIGKIYDGIVSSIKEFGAFVEILPGRDGLCHISELSTGYINSIDGVVNVGDAMKVLVIDVDEHDRVKLSRRRALEELGEEDEMAALVEAGGGGDGDEERAESRGGGRGRGRGRDRDRDRGDRDDRGRDRDDRGRDRDDRDDDRPRRRRGGRGRGGNGGGGGGGGRYRD
ncbi:MAG: S1 RNA-binding domain-containing protein, partial [Planctomycetota bacterium]